ncbi:MAG: hypothetical protein Ct9H90mP10_05040 [Actinomycetota bacterium]|nr:MAG: hypothetical protein Ct9H90mP10_05040 [Actinomycetota bacterium]
MIPFGSNNFGGNSIEFGIREHAMGGIVNGLALHSNLIPYGSTFLCFLRLYEAKYAISIFDEC